MEFDIAIEAGQLLSMDPSKQRIEKDKVIGIRASKIEKIFDSGTLKWSAKKTINAKKKLVMPGLINGHCHLSMNLFRGMKDDLPFHEWLFDNILPLEARLVSPEFVKLGADLAMLESLYFGITTVSDMYYFADHVGDAVIESGLRGLIGESVADFGPPDQKTEKGFNFRIMEKMIAEQHSSGRVTTLVAPHAPYSCSDETLQEAMAFAEKHSLGFAIHVSETKKEVEDSFKQFGKSPVKRLYNLGLMKHDCIFAHGIHLSDEDIELIAKTNTSIIYNPESNMKLGSGTCRVPDLLKANINVGIGTDSVASNNDLNLFKEMDQGAKLQKLINEDNTALTARKCLEMATSMGAKAQHLDNIGIIREGMLADVICLDMRKPWLEPMHDVEAHLVYSANGSEVEDVICHGEVLLENRKPTRVDPEELFDRATAYRKRNHF